MMRVFFSLQTHEFGLHWIQQGHHTIRCSVMFSEMQPWFRGVVRNGHRDALGQAPRNESQPQMGGFVHLKGSAQSLRCWAGGILPVEYSPAAVVFYLVFHWLSFILLLWPSKGFSLGIILFHIPCHHHPYCQFKVYLWASRGLATPKLTSYVVGSNNHTIW